MLSKTSLERLIDVLSGGDDPEMMKQLDFANSRASQVREEIVELSNGMRSSRIINTLLEMSVDDEQES